MNKKRRSKKRKGTAFWKGASIYIGLLAVVCVGILALTWGAMVRFEENAPDYAKDTLHTDNTAVPDTTAYIPDTTIPITELPAVTENPPPDDTEEVPEPAETTSAPQSEETTEAETAPPEPEYPPADKEDAEKVNAFCESFIRDYVKFVADGYTDTEANHNRVMSYFAEGTESHTVMKASIEAVKWNSTFVSHEYNKLEFGEVTYDGRFYRTEIIFDVTLYRYSVVNNYAANFTLAIEKSGEGFLITECNF